MNGITYINVKVTAAGKTLRLLMVQIEVLIFDVSCDLIPHNRM